MAQDLIGATGMYGLYILHIRITTLINAPRDEATHAQNPPIARRLHTPTNNIYNSRHPVPLLVSPLQT